MNIFLTGGSGFVGQNIIPTLHKQGYHVFALTRSQRSADKVSKLGATPVMDDLHHLSAHTKQALQRCEAVVHSAAYMDFTYDPRPYYATNVKATQALLAMAQAEGINKFVYISAAPVVPGSPIHNLTEDQASAGLPKDLYPKTKAIAERAVLAANQDTFQTIALRPPAIWGPNNPHLGELFTRAEQGVWRWIGGSHHVLSTIHVQNLANAIVAALKADQGGEAYFVTDGDRRSMRDTFSAIMRSQQIDPGDKEMPRAVAVFLAQFFGTIWKWLRLGTRPPISPLMIRLMATEFSVSDEKARRELGYQNAISFEEGLASL